MEKVVIGGATLYCGDALEVLGSLDKNSVNVAVTSPPYNLCKRYTDYSSTRTSCVMSEKYSKWYDDELPEWLYQGYQQSCIHEMLRVCDSSIFYNHKVRFAWHNRNLYRTESNIHHPMNWLNKFPLWCEIIWDRGGIGNPTRRYHNQDERVYQIGKPRKWHDMGLTTIWRITPTKNNDHVCTFPPKLVENCILPTTDAGDVVLDPFMGVGTAGLVSIQHGRRFVGVERDKRYFDIACEKFDCFQNIY